MTNYNLEESELIKAQIILSFILLLTTVISITLSYNFLMKIEEKNTIYSDEESAELLIINRIIMFVVAAIFIYINIRDKGIKEKYNLEDDFSDLQIIASIFSLIAAAIVLYVGVQSGNNLTSEENPTI